MPRAEFVWRRGQRRLTSGSSPVRKTLCRSVFCWAWRKAFISCARAVTREGPAVSHPVQLLKVQGRKLQRVPALVPLTTDIRVCTLGLDEALDVSRALDALLSEHRTVLMLWSGGRPHPLRDVGRPGSACGD